jgi:AcrR family transcriptional regulator
MHGQSSWYDDASMSDPRIAEESTAEPSSHDRLLQAARMLFATQGYENTTTSIIARTAGTSESQLIKHFGSKEGLLEAIFDQGWQRMGRGLQQLLEQPSAPLYKLRALIELMISSLERDRELRSLLLLEGRRIRKHDRMILLTRGFTQVVAVLDSLFAELRKAGQIRPGLHLQAIRSALVGAYEGLLRDQLLAERTGYPATYSAAELRAAFAALLDGVLVGEPGS